MNFKKLVMIVGIMPGNLFFMALAILGIEYKGKESTPIYIIYCLGLALIIVGIFIKEFWKRKIRINKENKLLVGLIFFILGQAFFYSIITGTNLIRNESFRFFILWTIPSICSGIYLANMVGIKGILKDIEMIMLVLTGAILVSVIIPATGGIKFETVGGATYQTAGYMGALAYGLNLYYIMHWKNNQSYAILRIPFKRIAYIVLAIVQISGVLISGARGAVVLIVIYSVVNVVVELKRRNFRGKFRTICLVIILAMGIGTGLPRLAENQLIENGLNRIFQFVESDGINWSEGTSGRDIVYKKGMEDFSNSPIVGKGIFEGDIYYHNIGLDILVQVGIVGLLISVIIFIVVIKKMIKLLNNNFCNWGIVMLGLFPIVMLMFSGRYIYTSELWFIIAFICSSTLGGGEVKNENSSHTAIL